MNLLDIVAIEEQGKKIEKSPIFINSGSLGLTSDEKTSLVQEVMRFQYYMNKKCDHRKGGGDRIQVSSYRGVIRSVGDYTHFTFNGERFKIRLSNSEQAGEVDLLLGEPTHLTCGSFEEKPAEEKPYSGRDYSGMGLWDY